MSSYYSYSRSSLVDKTFYSNVALSKFYPGFELGNV
jgi:hypothetical protein